MGSYFIPVVGTVIEARRLPADPWVRTESIAKPPGPRQSDLAELWVCTGTYTFEVRHVSKDGPHEPGWPYKQGCCLWRWPDEVVYEIPKVGDLVEYRAQPPDPWIAARVVDPSNHGEAHRDGAEFVVEDVWRPFCAQVRHVSKTGTPWGWDDNSWVWRWPEGNKPAPEVEVEVVKADFPSETAKILYYYGSVEVYKKFKT